MLKLFTTLFLLFPVSAFAATTTPAAPQSGLISFLPLVVIFVIFYFLLIRPQLKKAKEQQVMLNNIKIGNNVCTMSGIIGKVRKIDDKESIVFLEIAEDVNIKILKASISQLLDSQKLAELEDGSDKTKKSKNKKSKS